jgi:sulfur carrier protein
METAETKLIQVVLNGHPKRVPQGLDVSGLLEWLEIPAARVAVELDRQIVRKPAWPATPVREGASIEIVWFVGGG